MKSKKSAVVDHLYDTVVDLFKLNETIPDMKACARVKKVIGALHIPDLRDPELCWETQRDSASGAFAAPPRLIAAEQSQQVAGRINVPAYTVMYLLQLYYIVMRDTAIHESTHQVLANALAYYVSTCMDADGGMCVVDPHGGYGYRKEDQDAISFDLCKKIADLFPAEETAFVWMFQTGASYPMRIKRSELDDPTRLIVPAYTVYELNTFCIRSLGWETTTEERTINGIIHVRCQIHARAINRACFNACHAETIYQSQWSPKYVAADSLASLFLSAYDQLKPTADGENHKQNNTNGK